MTNSHRRNANPVRESSKKKCRDLSTSGDPSTRRRAPVSEISTRTQSRHHFPFTPKRVTQCSRSKRTRFVCRLLQSIKITPLSGAFKSSRQKRSRRAVCERHQAGHAGKSAVKRELLPFTSEAKRGLNLLKLHNNAKRLEHRSIVPLQSALGARRKHNCLRMSAPGWGPG